MLQADVQLFGVVIHVSCYNRSVWEEDMYMSAVVTSGQLYLPNRILHIKPMKTILWVKKTINFDSKYARVARYTHNYWTVLDLETLASGQVIIKCCVNWYVSYGCHDEVIRSVVFPSRTTANWIQFPLHIVHSLVKQQFLLLLKMVTLQ